MQSPLSIALLAYIDRLFRYSIVYILDLIKTFYDVYHNIRRYTRLIDPIALAH